MNLEETNFIKRLLVLSKKEKDILINNIVSVLNEVHSIKNEEINCLEEYYTDINVTIHNYSLIKKYGFKDYILTDYIKENSYLIKDRIASRLIFESSIFNFNIDKILSIGYMYSDKFGDQIIDLVDLNIIAYYDSKFASKLLDKYIGNNYKQKFLKIFSFYSAKKTIDLIISSHKVKDKIVKEEYENIINFIFDTYEDFTNYKPKWYVN